MQYKIRLIVLIALITALIFAFFQIDEYKSLSNKLFDQNKDLQDQLTNDTLLKKVKILEKENKLLKDQLYRLENQQFIFNKSNQMKNYKLDDKKFKDDTKDILKENLQEFEEETKEEGVSVTPSFDYNKEKGDIGVKLQVETTF